MKILERVSALVGAGLLILATANGATARSLDIYFIDVEGGQSTLLVTPSHESLLIDTGWAGSGAPDAKPGNPAQARDARRIVDAAKDAGIKQIDYLLITHFHPDHDGGVVELSQLMPIRHFIDHSTLSAEAQKDAGTKAAFEAYLSVRNKAQHIDPKPGEPLPLKGINTVVVASDAATLESPLAGAGAPNSACGQTAQPARDPLENPRSTGFLATFGQFRFLDLGDLSGQPLFHLACPRSLIGPVSVYLVAHHGGPDVADPATFVAFQPRVAIMNNGLKKGGSRETYETLHHVAGLEDVWQLHRSESAGDQNFPADQIANLDESTAHWLKLTASEDGTFRVVNPRTGQTKSYPPPTPRSGSASVAFPLESLPGRLPKNVVPVSYDIAISPNVDALSMTGTESVILQFGSATDTLVFNSVNERLSDVRLDGQPVKSVASDDDKQWSTVKLGQPAAAGRHTLTFSYTGKIETRPRGLFVQHYTFPGTPDGVMLSTQMESVDARRMFPCWDEPVFKATFQLTVTVPSKWAAVSNMPIAKREPHGSLTTTTFQATPKMSSYLVELTTGDLAQISASNGGVEFGIWAVRGQEQYGKRALADAQRILADYNEYFAYPYPLPKLDSIAVPGGFSGAMENWGAITYNDMTLLLPPSSTQSARPLIFSFQAHEMAHLWYGDLVTMSWWDDLWLNESFASWMAAKETERAHPEWHWWEDQDDSKENAMHADAVAGSHAIQQHVVNELQIDNAIDPAITYDKGQAILRMLEAYVGPETFRDGIRAYMRAHAFSSASTTDLWQALNAASGKNVGQIASAWTAQPGFPLIAATATCDSSGQRTVRLSQSRFLLQGSENNPPHWNVPLQVRVGATGTPQSVLLSQDAQMLPVGRCDEPLSLNANGVGYYRVRYDATTLASNTKEFARLPVGDRIALLDDQWALVGSGKESLRSYLALAQSLGSDLDVRIWEQVESALSTIEYDERGTADYNAFTTYARSVLKAPSEKLGWDSQPQETPTTTALRRTLLKDLGQWGDPAVIAEARRRFDAFQRNRLKLTPDDLLTVVQILARRADAATFDKLYNLAKTGKDISERRRYYSALMLVKDDSLASRAARIALSPEIPAQLASERLEFVMELAKEHQQMAWKTFTEHSQELLTPHSPYEPLITAQYLPEFFWSGIPLDQLDAWIRSHVPSEMADTVDRGMQAARYKAAEKQVLLSASDAWKTPAGQSSGR